MKAKSTPSPHEEFLSSDEKANELFDFVCAELTDAQKNPQGLHYKFHIASRANKSLKTYYFAGRLLEMFEKTPITKIDFDFSEQYDDNGNGYFSTSANLFYVLKNPDGSFTEEKSCELYSSDINDIDDEDLCDFLKENPEAGKLISKIADTIEGWEEDDVDRFHDTIFEKHNVMLAYKNTQPEIYPLIEKFILSNFVAEAKEKAPKRSISKM